MGEPVGGEARRGSRGGRQIKKEKKNLKLLDELNFIRNLTNVHKFDFFPEYLRSIIRLNIQNIIVFKSTSLIEVIVVPLKRYC